MLNASGVKRTRVSIAGFTLVELIVVVGIIGLLAAVAAPPIRNYMLTTRIRAGASQVAGEIQTARQKAISKNVNFGVVFLVASNNTYRWVMEDDMSPPFTHVRPSMSALVTDTSQVGPLRTLPPQVTFTTVGPTSKGIRFGNLGGSCDPASAATTCPDLDTGSALVKFDGAASEFTLKLTDARTQMTRTVRVTTGGRIYVQ